MTCAETLNTSAFIDGELDGVAAEQAEAHIASCPHCQAFVAAAAEASEPLRAPSARFTAPPLLRARVRRALECESRLRPGFWIGMLGGVGAGALAASLALMFAPTLMQGDLAARLADDHVRALTSGPRIEVVSSSHHTVKPWFAGRAPIAPPVGDFAAQGFPLLGGRLDTVAGRKAAVVVYGHGLHEIDLYVWRAGGGPLPAASDRLGYHEVFWRRGDLELAAVSDTDSTELNRFVALVQALRE